MKMRIGQGVDVHAFCDGDFVMLGGVKIPHSSAIAAHSDGDVALHALCDAMLGACAMGDIGLHFPPSDPQWAGANSIELLRQVYLMVRHEGWFIVNADITIICELPKIAPHAEQMRVNIAEVLDAEASQISIKATTTEGLGFCGRQEGISAQAIILLQSW